QYLGPRPIFRPAFPHVPFAGTVNAARLNHCASVCPPGGMIDMPGTTSGRWFDRLPSGISDALRVTTMFTGRPVLAVASPLNSQPPSSFPAAPPAWRPKGSWYTQFVVIV